MVVQMVSLLERFYSIGVPTMAANGVLNIEVLQYRTAYCGSNGVLNIEVFCTGLSLDGTYLPHCTVRTLEM